MADKLFRVIEHFNGYEVEHIASGQRHWMSDGVDAVPLNDEGDYMAPGTEEFRQAWEDQLNADASVTLEAYFPDIANPPSVSEAKKMDRAELIDMAGWLNAEYRQSDGRDMELGFLYGTAELVTSLTLGENESFGDLREEIARQIDKEAAKESYPLLAANGYVEKKRPS